MKIRPSLAIFRNGKILLLRYRYPSGEVFCIPGGGVEEGETIKATLHREFQEELSVRVRIEGLCLVYEAKPQGPLCQTLHLVFHGHLASGPIRLNPVHTTAKEAIWMPREHLPQIHLYPDVGQYLAGEAPDAHDDIPFIEGKGSSAWVY